MSGSTKRLIDGRITRSAQEEIDEKWAYRGEQARIAKRKAERQTILSAASAVIGYPAAQVVALAKTIHAWVDQATDEDDRDLRLNAVNQACANHRPSRYAGTDHAETFHAETATLYAFLSA